MEATKLCQILVVLAFGLKFVNVAWCQTIDDINNNPNNFYMFEDFELTREIYIKEHVLVSKLEKIRELLQQQQELLTNYLNKKRSLKEIQPSLKVICPALKEHINATKELTHDFPSLTGNEPGHCLQNKLWKCIVQSRSRGVSSRDGKIELGLSNEFNSFSD